jgi:hypothetical protein
MSDNGQIFFQVPILCQIMALLVRPVPQAPLAATWLVFLSMGHHLYIQKRFGEHLPKTKNDGEKNPNQNKANY